MAITCSGITGPPESSCKISRQVLAIISRAPGLPGCREGLPYPPIIQSIEPTAVPRLATLPPAISVSRWRIDVSEHQEDSRPRPRIPHLSASSIFSAAAAPGNLGRRGVFGDARIRGGQGHDPDRIQSARNRPFAPFAEADDIHHRQIARRAPGHFWRQGITG